MDLERDDSVLIGGLDFDAANREHLATHGIDDGLCWEVALDRPVFVRDRRGGQSGTHFLIGESAARRIWTLVILCVDDDLMIWRPITGWPATRRQIRAWRSAD